MCTTPSDRIEGFLPFSPWTYLVPLAAINLPWLGEGGIATHKSGDFGDGDFGWLGRHPQ